MTYQLLGAFALAEGGMCTSHIAKEMGVSVEAVRGWARRNAISVESGRGGRTPTPQALARAERMASMFRQGLTLQKIASTFNLTRERVRQILKKHGVVYTDGGGHKLASVKKQARHTRRTINALAKYGMTLEQLEAVRKAGAPRRFQSQRGAADKRGIEWSLTLAQWWDIWQTSGKWDLRGRGKGRYVMSRIKDTGGYEIGNVHIQLGEQNSLEAVEKWRGKTKASPGVFCLYPGTDRPYIAKFRKHQIARCSTEAEAASARMAWLQANGYGLRDNGHAFLKAA